MRVFVGVDPGADARAALSAVLAEVDVPGRPAPPENWHVTLRYLGAIDEVTLDRLTAGLDEADLPKAFVTRMTGLGAFPAPKRATVLWVGLTPGRLEELAETVDDIVERIGHGREERPFVGHMTLARIRPAVDVSDLIDAVEIPSIPIPVDRVTIFESVHADGRPRYRAIESIDL